MDPGLVWLFYGYRRHQSLIKQPNPGHKALAELAQRNPNFLCLTQNVDSECNHISAMATPSSVSEHPSAKKSQISRREQVIH